MCVGNRCWDEGGDNCEDVLLNGREGPSAALYVKVVGGTRQGVCVCDSRWDATLGCRWRRSLRRGVGCMR